MGRNDKAVPTALALIALTSVASADTWTEHLLATSPVSFTSSLDRTYFAVGSEIQYFDQGASSPVALDSTSLAAALQDPERLLALNALRLNQVDPPSRLLASGSSGGIAISTDNGQTWTRLTDPLLNTTPDGTVVFAIDYDSPDALLAGTSEGLLRSTDGGAHWSNTAGIPADSEITVIDFSGQVSYAAGAGHVYSSVDAGQSWSQADAGIVAGSEISSFADSRNATFVGTAHATEPGVFKTTDDGASWTRVPVTGTGTFRVASSVTGLYVARNEGLLRSVDGGDTWIDIDDTPPGDWTDLYLDPTTPGRVLRGSADSVQTYTVASDLVVTATGGPTVPAAQGARAQFQFTVTNRGPHHVVRATLDLERVADHLLFVNPSCTSPNTFVTQSEVLNCNVGSLAPGESKVLTIESTFQTSSAVEIRASVKADEAELTDADNVLTYRATYNAPPASNPPARSGGGGGGSFSWWMLLVLAAVVTGGRRYEARGAG